MGSGGIPQNVGGCARCTTRALGVLVGKPWSTRAGAEQTPRHQKIFANLAAPSRGIANPSWGAPPSLRFNSKAGAALSGHELQAGSLAPTYGLRTLPTKHRPAKHTAALRHREKNGRSPADGLDFVRFCQ